MKPSVASACARLAAGVIVAGTLASPAIVSHAQFGPRAFKLPKQFSPQALEGQKAYDANCAACHGRFGIGTDKGPPLNHDIYNPGHHADQAFYAAAQRGVRQHHWTFGDMPAQPQVSPEQIGAIVRYIREIQLANGIVYRPHRM